MRFVLAIISILSLLGALLFFTAIRQEPFAGALSLLCLLLFVVSGGFASVIERMHLHHLKVEAALKDIASSNAAMSTVVQNRSNVP